MTELDQAKVDVEELRQENDYLKAQVKKLAEERALLLELLPKVKRGYEA